MTEAERRIHVECLAYDQGQRDALREQLRMLHQLAEKQAIRSEQTAGHCLAGDYERRLHAGDIMLLDHIAAAITAK